MGRSKHTPEREHETFRGINRREECEGEREKEQARPRGEYLEDRRGRNLYTPMIPGSGCRSKYTPRREPETLSGYGRREEYEGERGRREGERASICRCL